MAPARASALTPGEPDELLMAQVAKGRGESLEPLVRRYTVPLVSFLQRMTGNRDRAEDLFQEILMEKFVFGLLIN